MCYFVDFNHHSGLSVSLFIVVLVFVDVEKKCSVCVCACACDGSESLSTCDTMLCHFLNDCNTPLEQAAGYEPRTKRKGATRKP